MRKRLLSILTLIGIALDIRDMAGLIRWGIICVGGSALITGVLRAFVDQVSDESWLIGVGLFLLLLASLPSVYGWAYRRIQRGTSTPTRIVPPNGSFVFDPYSIYTNLGGVDLSGLFKPESYMVFTLNVRNVSGHPIEITGTEGRIRCCGEECNMPLTVERKPRKLPSSDSLVPCAIRQPIGNGMLQMIDQKRIQLYGSLVFDLSSLKWTGSVESPGGRVSLENCYLWINTFVVQGPIRREEDGATLFAPQAKFLSSNHYLSDGRRKEGD